MPNTHPQYRLAVEVLGGPLRTSTDATSRTLDKALHEAARACRSYGWCDQRYYVEPVPGTEPRYRVLTTSGYHSGLLWPDARASAWGRSQPCTWAEARAVFEEWSRYSCRAHRSSLLVVPA